MKDLLSGNTAIYRPLFFSYFALGIDILETNDKSMKKYRFIKNLISYILTGIAIFITFALLGYLLDGVTQITMSSIFLLYTGHAFRLLLHKNRKKIRQIIIMLHNFTLPHSQEGIFMKMEKQLLYACSFIVIFYVTSMGCIFYSAIASYPVVIESSVSPTFYLLLNHIHSKAIATFSILLLTTVYTFHLLPSALFALFYGVLSWHVSKILSQTKKRMKLYPAETKHNHREYCKVCHLVDFVDKRLNKLSIIYVIYISSMLYFTVFSLLKPELKFHLMMIVSCLNLVLQLIIFSYSTSVASDIPVINDEMLKIVTDTAFNGYLSDLKANILFRMQQSLYFTVGGIVPVRKGIFLALTGTVITYSLVIRSFSSD